MKTINEAINWRYSTKVFDASKKIPAEDFEQIKDMLQMSPSSTNIQPWSFVIADDDAGKARIAKSTQGAFHFNTPKVLDASHVVVFCTRIHADDEYMQAVLEKEDQDGRYAQPEFKAQMHQGRQLFLDMHRFDTKDEPHWLAKQVYLNMGGVLLGSALLGIDTVPMEGVDLQALDTEFDLRSKGYSAVAVVSFGYRSDDDFNAKIPKSRLSEETIFIKA